MKYLKPMGKKLLSCSYILHIGFLFFFLCMHIKSAEAQISITGTYPHEVVFTSENSTINNSLARISLSDISMVSPGYTGETEEWFEADNGTTEAGNFYIETGNGELSVGQFSADSGSSFSVSYKNESAHDFESLNIAFDFIHGEFADEHLYTLLSRVNGSAWKRVDGGEIRASSLSSGSEDWNSFSVQLHMNDIYLRKNDQIDLRWISNTDSPGRLWLPLALQRVEVSPYAVTRDPIKKGSLIVTEILPQTLQDDESIEYIEIYNPTEEPVPVKGLTIQGELGETVIQKNAIIAPYSFFVVANEAATLKSEIRADYTYTGVINPEVQGAVAIRSQDTEIANISYRTPEQGMALELNQAKHSFDGYSSMEYLEPSVQQITSGLRGSPGLSGTTVRMFTKEIQEPGWYLVSPPGHLIEELNRNSSISFSGMDKAPVLARDLSVSEPFFMYKEGQDPATIYTEAVPEREALSFTSSLNEDAVVAGFTSPETFRISNIINGNDERAAPALKVWSPSEQRFKLLFDEEDKISGWDPVILNKSVSQSLHVDTTGRQASGSGLSRYLRFRLYEEKGNSRTMLDDGALLGFLRQSNRQEELRYDLPKLLPVWTEEDETELRSLIYLTSPENNQISTSFSHLPFELDQVYKVRLGHFAAGPPGNFTLDWSQFKEIPEEWIFTLEDTYTGRVVDMKEQTSYNFRASGGNRIELNESNSAFIPFKPVQNERFLITLEPYEDLFSNSEEVSQPDDVELHQNYPNPFNPATTISFYLPEERSVRLGIYNVVGQQVALLIDDTVTSGEHSVPWNASEMPSGIYIVQLEMGNRMLTRKITLIK